MPAPYRQIAIELAAAIAPAVPIEHLSFGGGTVLAARWGHRTSTDVDLFATPATWEALSEQKHQEIEARLAKHVDGYAASDSWSGYHQAYARIRGTEATVLPRQPGPAPPASEHRYLRGTELRLQANTEILYGKIRQRMMGQYVVAIRDAYDICSAAIHDPEALRSTVETIGRNDVRTFASLVRELAPGWSHHDPKKLISPTYRWDETTLTRRLAATLDQAAGQAREGHGR